MNRYLLPLFVSLSFVFSQGGFAAENQPEQIDCASLKIDYIHMLPEIIEPKAWNPPNPPFTEDDIKRLDRSAENDPNGLCHYRDANRAVSAVGRNRVVFIGDSITEYWALGDRELFTGEIFGRGVSSQNSSQILLRFRNDVIALHPSVVHILAGINDAMSPNGTLLTRSNIMSMVELARANKIKVILGTLPPADRFWLAPNASLAPFVAEHNRWLHEYAARESVTLADYYTELAGPDGRMPSLLANDGLHPNKLGYAKMRSVARKALREALLNKNRN